ncbi:prolyl oligopeptidase family serine peptidase [Nocardia sp. NPDC050712]|uniref:alpha/beta hydrolase family protein n=1 Tax=Nocardia sp. NPDC050712 TaxID=3155518 RepID=UPI0033E69CA6
MRRGIGVLVTCATLLGLLAVGPAAAEPYCDVRIAVRQVSLQVDGEEATGRVYEPYRCTPGDLQPRNLVVAVHGHGGSSGDLADYLTSIARRTATPFLVMDMRNATSTWKTGDWNLWAGWRDIVAATEWYTRDKPVERTVLWGWSQGGITSGLALAHGPRGLFDYWVDNYGPADNFTMWVEAPKIAPGLRRQIERDAGGCTPIVCPQSYYERSPALLAHKIDVDRAFLVHGTSDDVIPFRASTEMRDALAAAGTPLSMYTVVSGRGLDGTVVPGDHSVGPAFFEGGCVVERLVTDAEPVTGSVQDYVIDIAQGVQTAPPAPELAKCAA